MDDQIVNKKVKTVVEEVEYPPILEIQKRINDFFFGKFLENSNWMGIVSGYTINNNVGIIKRPVYEKTDIGEGDYRYTEKSQYDLPWLTSFTLEVRIVLNHTPKVIKQTFNNGKPLGHYIGVFDHFIDELEWAIHNSSSQSEYSFT